MFVFLGIAAFLMVYDWKRRAIPRAVPIIGVVMAGWMVPDRTLIGLIAFVGGIVTGVMVALLAGLPSGDVAVGGLIGAWLGIEQTVLVWVLALLVGHIIWAAWEDRLIDWPGEWPFTPLLLAPACAMVLGKGI